MTPEQLQQAYQTMANQISTESARVTNQIGAGAEAKAPGLAYPTGGVGAYNYNRLMSPVVEPVVTQLVAAGKQAAFKQSLQDSYNQAANRYKNAYSSYATRQRAAQSAASSGSSAGQGSTSSERGGVDIVRKQTQAPLYGTLEAFKQIGKFFGAAKKEAGKFVGEATPTPSNPFMDIVNKSFPKQ